MKYVMALDQGTTSCRCILFDRAGAVCALAQEEFNQYYPQPGWVEHDALEIWNCQRKVAQQAMAKLRLTADQIAGIGIANQRETTVVWEKATGRPVYNAIVWQCHRTAGEVDALVAQGHGDMIRAKTGLVPDAYFSATKLKWILDRVDGARERARRGELLFGTIDTWLIWNLTGGKAHVTDYSNASRTMLFDIRRLDWDDELLALLDIPRAMLPEVKPSGCLYGQTDPSLFGGAVPVCGAAGDQQAAMFGQCCFAPGEAKNTYGTGCFLLMNTGHQAIRSQNGLLTTVAAGLDDRVQYALEGSIFIGGAVVQWLRDEMHLIDQSLDCEYFARKLPDSGGVYFVPAFTGLGAPYWNQYTRGCVFGLTRGTGKEHLIRAALEAIAYQTADVCRAMEQDSGIALTALKVDGGAARNDLLMQFQSDVLNAQVIRPACVETTALGAAYLAGLTVGFWHDREEIMKNQSVQRVFSPAMEDDRRSALLTGWKQAIDCALVWGDGQKRP